MGKPKPPRGTYRESVHDGSSVTLSQLRVKHPDGEGKNSKSVEKRIRRHYFFKLIHETRRYGQRDAIPNIFAIYRGELKTRRV